MYTELWYIKLISVILLSWGYSGPKCEKIHFILIIRTQIICEFIADKLGRQYSSSFSSSASLWTRFSRYYLFRYDDSHDFSNSTGLIYLKFLQIFFYRFVFSITFMYKFLFLLFFESIKKNVIKIFFLHAAAILWKTIILTCPYFIRLLF